VVEAGGGDFGGYGREGTVRFIPVVEAGGGIGYGNGEGRGRAGSIVTWEDDDEALEPELSLLRP